MSGRIYQFGQTELPGAAAKWNVSASVNKNYLKTLGGAYDPQRSDRSNIELPQALTVSALAYAPTQQQLGATLDDYRALLGVRERLWLKPHDSTQVDRWCWARLTDVAESGSVYNRIHQPVELTFMMLSGWNGHSYGGAWNLDAGYYFDNGLYLDGSSPVALGASTNVTLTNAGNRPCHNLGITISASMSSVTNLTFTVASVAQFSWSGSFNSGKTLTIDCGARSILLNGVAAYSGFELGPNHYVNEWLPLNPGATTLTVTATGTPLGMTGVFTYSDQWT